MIKKLTGADVKSIGRDHIWFPEVGEKVEITVSIGRKPAKMKGPELGEISHIDGEYISVDYGKPVRTGEFYKSELKLIQHVDKGIGKKKRGRADRAEA